MTESTTNGFNRYFLMATALMAFAFFIALGFWPPERKPQQGRATEAFRRHHRRYHEQVAHLSSVFETIHDACEMEQIELMAAAVALLREDLLPHARAEELHLYPAADRLAGGGANPFTAVLRFEHRLLERWTEDLAAIAADPFPDHNAFCLRGERLLGLLEAHLAAEEEVVLPLLDRTMTPEQFRREVGEGMGIGGGNRS